MTPGERAAQSMRLAHGTPIGRPVHTPAPSLASEPAEDPLCPIDSTEAGRTQALKLAIDASRGSGGGQRPATPQEIVKIAKVFLRFLSEGK
jgi:hypothetical protein